MRMVVLTTFFVFVASVNHELTGLIRYSHDSISTIWTKEVFPRYEETSWTEINVEDIGPTILKVLNRSPFNYVVVGDDTTRVENDIVEHGGWDQISPEEIFLSTQILDEITIPLAFYHPNAQNPCSRFIVLCNQDSLSTIAPAVVYDFQIDQDPELEIIVEAIDGWQHHYFMYEQDVRAWKFSGKISCYNRSPESCKPDLSLNGYLGFEEHGWGIMFASTDINYCAIDKDKLVECFTVPQFVMIELFDQSADGCYDLVGSSTVRRKNNSMVISVDEEANYLNDNLERSLIYRNQYQFIYSSTDGIHFVAITPLVDFDSGSVMNELFPEAHLGKKLMTLKNEGSPHQQEILKGYDFEFLDYTR